MTKLGITLFLACLVTLFTYPVALAQTIKQEQADITTAASPPPESSSLLTLTYAKVATGGVPVYAHPNDAALGNPPVRWLDSGYVWVSLPEKDAVKVRDQLWYNINDDEYVQADYLQFFEPSTFHGITSPRANRFAWIVFDTWTAEKPATAPNEETKQWLKRYDIVNILSERRIHDRVWYKIANGHWIEQGKVGIINAKPRPEGVGPRDKWIEVDLYEQTLAAYEGNKMVYATLVSSGLPWWQTEEGLFQVWVKIEQGKMSGREGFSDYYFLEDVPWALYFSGSYALHGAYWHDRFGIKHSHGCVNLAPADAKWLYDWATPEGNSAWLPATDDNEGTWVWVHEQGALVSR
ncbi:MAG: L,D-transpeptidase [Anaerolineae bacterium]|nr:L,D-transpeptidase [Anaerolineae bacterium]